MITPNRHRSRFQMLVKAAREGNLALMDATEIATGQLRFVLVGAVWQRDHAVIIPLGHLVDAPLDAYRPFDR